MAAPVPPLDPPAASRIVGIAGLSAQGAHTWYARREFMEVGLAEDDGAGLPKASNDERVFSRYERCQSQGRAGRRHVRRVVVVLEDDGNAVQRSAHLSGAPLCIHGPRVTFRRWVDADHRVERRSALVVGGDAGEVGARQVERAERPRTCRAEGPRSWLRQPRRGHPVKPGASAAHRSPMPERSGARQLSARRLTRRWPDVRRDPGDAESGEKRHVGECAWKRGLG
jgi:hypothetical protein